MAAGAQQVLAKMRARTPAAPDRHRTDLLAQRRDINMKIGFIGLGIMGAPMALHLVDAGHQLYVHTRGKVPESIAASTAQACANAAEVTRHADVVFTMVPDTPDVEAVLFGEDGVAAGLQVGAAARARSSST